MESTIRITEEYETREYTKQRLETPDRTVKFYLENDKNKQSGIADFMRRDRRQFLISTNSPVPVPSVSTAIRR